MRSSRPTITLTERGSNLGWLLAAGACLLFACTGRPATGNDGAPSVAATGTTEPVAPGQPPTRLPAPQATPIPVPPTQPAPVPTVAAPRPTPPSRPIVIALPEEPETIHPFFARSPGAQAVAGALFIGCMGESGQPRGSFSPGGPLYFQPAVAALGCEMPPEIAGGLAPQGEGDDRYYQLTFHIRDGWRWTDGRPVTAQDALFGWKVAMDPAAQLTDPATIKVFSMSAIDTRTVQVRFMSPRQAREAAQGALRGNVPFEYFSQSGAYDAYAKETEPLFDDRWWSVVRWLPAHKLSGFAPADQMRPDFAPNLIGDSAFALGAWNRGREMTLVRSNLPLPPMPGLPPEGNAAGLVFQFGGDQRFALAAVANGSADVTLPMDKGTIDSVLRGSLPTFLAHPAVSPRLDHLILNIDQAPFDDARVRQALLHGLDYPALASSAEVTAPERIAREYDPALAASLLRGAGWNCAAFPCTRVFTDTNRARTPVTRTLEFTLTYSSNVAPENAALAAWFQAQATKIGMQTHLQEVEQAILLGPRSAKGILQSRAFAAALLSTPLPLRLDMLFGCERIPSATPNGLERTNLSGYCVRGRTPAGWDLLATGAQSSTKPAALVEDLYRETIVDAAGLLPLGLPIRVVPARPIRNLDFSGYGVVTWNAWAWSTP